MRQWTVRIYYTVTTEYEVTAETKEDAHRLADDIADLPDDLARRVQMTARQESFDHLIWPAD